jgi:hypothetical protein
MTLSALFPALLVAIVPWLSLQDPDKRRDAATYVFVGSVADPGAGRTGPEEGILVTVNEVLFQKGTFQDQRGRQVEVLNAPIALVANTRYVFYTEPVRFGARVVVRVIDLARANDTAATAERAQMKQDVGEAFAQREIRERATLAELVVVGTVTSVGPLGRGRAAESEHDPQFQVARLRVERALKGQAASAEIEFIFAASKDVQWFRAPKFRQNTRGVFFLQAPGDEVVRMGVERPGGRYSVLHPLDFRPAADIPRAEAALKGGRQ